MSTNLLMIQKFSNVKCHYTNFQVEYVIIVMSRSGLSKFQLVQQINDKGVWSEGKVRDFSGQKCANGRTTMLFASQLKSIPIM